MKKNSNNSIKITIKMKKVVKKISPVTVFRLLFKAGIQPLQINNRHYKFNLLKILCNSQMKIKRVKLLNKVEVFKSQIQLQMINFLLNWIILPKMKYLT